MEIFILFLSTQHYHYIKQTPTDTLICHYITTL